MTEQEKKTLRRMMIGSVEDIDLACVLCDQFLERGDWDTVEVVESAFVWHQKEYEAKAIGRIYNGSKDITLTILAFRKVRKKVRSHFHLHGSKDLPD